MRRIYESVIEAHFQRYPKGKMLFLAGPRQVGKTTIGMFAETLTDRLTYLNWDNQDHRQLILAGPAAIVAFAQITKLHAKTPIIVFDELHKYRQWKTLLKGFFDTYHREFNILVTGSSKLDVYRTGGDSLMGRYFPYRVHPLSVAECIRTELNTREISPPQAIDSIQFNHLIEFGGFPEPFLNSNKSFSRRWKGLRKEQLFRHDIRDLSRIHEIDHLEVLAELLKHQAGQLVNFSNLANKIKVSTDTVRRWVTTLNAFYYCFTVRPWSKNISRSLIKEPKIYLWDWSEVPDNGLRAENFVASHLLKAVHFWTDQGLGDYGLYFLRDKEKREVDFLVTKDQKPWFLVEVKQSDSSSINPHLEKYQRQLKAPHAFQVVLDMDDVLVDCFSQQGPMIVPGKTFLSQLI